MTLISPLFASKDISGSDVSLDTTNFDGALSSADDTSQKGFDTLDDAVAEENTWDRSGTELTPHNAGDDVNFGTGGLKDNDVTTAIELGDASNTSFNTTNKTIVGAVNEVLADIPTAVEDILTVSAPGQTAFTLSSTPKGNAAFALYLNGQWRLRGTDYTQTGTSLTWLDPSGLTLVTTDVLVARYNDTALASLTKEIFIAATDYNANLGNLRTREVAGTGAHRFTFYVPNQVQNILSIKLVGIVSAGAAGSGKDIDLASEYGQIGEPSNQHTESDTTSTYDFTGKSGQYTEVIDLTVVLTSILPGDYAGIFVDHNGIGGPIDYLGVKIQYT